MLLSGQYDKVNEKVTKFYEKNMKPIWILDDDKSIRWVFEKP